VTAAVPATVSGVIDDLTDADGYYRIQIGELLDGRYRVVGITGEGVFSRVVRALDTQEGSAPVAIKMIRSNEFMTKAALKEAQILELVDRHDQSHRFHCVRYYRHFQHRRHLCLVFESLQMNLRDLVKKVGRNEGLHISAVRSYAHQMLLALRLLAKCDIVHADLKPDNILVDETNKVVKLCDFGVAVHRQDTTPTSYFCALVVPGVFFLFFFCCCCCCSLNFF
jgi:serine/threonine-protein kinase PRP4